MTDSLNPPESDPAGTKLKGREIIVAVCGGIAAYKVANMIAKVAHGLCDDLVSLMISASACPVVFAPAMNERMWEHPVAQENVGKLTTIGYRFIGPEAGWLACRNVGAGRLSEAPKIVE